MRSARRLLLGVILILIASAVLILSDRSSRRVVMTTPDSQSVAPKRIAVIQISSIEAMNAARDGVIAQLAEAGYSQKSGTTFDFFNAEGDMGTLNQMAAQVCGASDPYDLIVSLSTVATQMVLRNNKQAIAHVFGLVASPPAIGIPLGPWTEGSTRPKNVAGFGTLQPAELLFGALLEADPTVKRVGCVWNPAEPNAEASVKSGREACRKLGLELIEANGGNVNEVVNAIDGVIANGIDCFWILADTNVIAAAKPAIARCSRSGVPVITNFPNMAELGAAINYGADYVVMGQSTGVIGQLVLGGMDPRQIPCENFVPTALWINQDGFAMKWKLTDALSARANRVYAGSGKPAMRTIEQPSVPPEVAVLLAAQTKNKVTQDAKVTKTQMPLIAAVTYCRTPNFEESWEGFSQEMVKLGYIDGKNCRIQLRDAQLDSGTLNTIVAAIAEERPDVVVPFTTPALQAVLRRIKKEPIVFVLTASGVAAGAGTSNTEHLPNVTGTQITSDWDQMIAVANAALPGVRRAGTVFAPGETNSVYNCGIWRKKLLDMGIELVSVGADRPTELPEAAANLATQDVQAIMQISDNSSSTGFAAIVKSADRAEIPVFAFAPGAMKSGATLAVARDFIDDGRAGARLVDRILRGESPAEIPFAEPEGSLLLVNPDRMKRFGITLPESMMSKAKVFREADGVNK